MFELIQSLDDKAWAGIGTALGAGLAAGLAAWRGTKRTPPEVGLPKPPTDQIPYVLRELRELNRKHDEGSKLMDRRFEEAEKMLGKIHTDTQVLRDRER